MICKGCKKETNMFVKDKETGEVWCNKCFGKSKRWAQLQKESRREGLFELFLGISILALFVTAVVTVLSLWF